MQKEEDFNIRTYTKTELGQLYNPELSQPRARQILHRWILANKNLYDELLKSGYHERAQILTPKHVGIIVKYLGEP